VKTIGGIDVAGVGAIERFGRIAKLVQGCDVPFQAAVLSLNS
jgi:hypothetical protein